MKTVTEESEIIKKELKDEYDKIRRERFDLEKVVYRVQSYCREGKRVLKNREK